jgi:tRNA G10  N-methylase Trm11
LQFKSGRKWSVWQANALDITKWPENNILVTEGFLGFKQVNKQLISKLDVLYTKLLSALSKTYPKNKRLVICLPYWNLNKQEKVFLPVVGKLKQLGLRSLFDETGSHGLLYKRQGQNTGHQILILSKSD